jgi:hypothetical protein
MLCNNTISEDSARTKIGQISSPCPNCGRDLARKPTGTDPPRTVCPFCGVSLTFVWWQRIFIAAVALVLTFGVPWSIGTRGMALVLAGLFFCYPSLVLAIILIFKVLRPRYTIRAGSVTTLFPR